MTDLKKSYVSDEPVGAFDIMQLRSDHEEAYIGTRDPALLFEKELECILLLLEARALLGDMAKMHSSQELEKVQELTQRQEEEKKRKGALTVTEIQAILKSQPEMEDLDLSSTIQQLKEQLALELRRNNQLDQDLAKLDKKIALLIKNKGNIKETLYAAKQSQRRRKVRSVEGDERPDLLRDPRKMEQYQELFYLLQTEPRYLAKLLYLVGEDDMNSFLKTVISSLYGEAFSPREEFLVLRLFQLAIQQELSKMKSPGEFLQVGTGEGVVKKMINLYNRRRQGADYLRKTVGPIIKSLTKRELNLELQPQIIYQRIIADYETSTGQPSPLDREAPLEQILANPDVQRELKLRSQTLEEICQILLDCIINSISSLPYGIRWICKQIRNLSLEIFLPKIKSQSAATAAAIGDMSSPPASPAVPRNEGDAALSTSTSTKQLTPAMLEDEILKVCGYFVYYSFINLAIVTPDALPVKILDDVPQTLRKNLTVVSKVFQNLFHFRRIGEGAHWGSLNEWIDRRTPNVTAYLTALMQVDDPEDYLQVSKYNELTQKTKPVILISLHEIAETHAILYHHLDALAGPIVQGAPMDPLRQILHDLGPPPPSLPTEVGERLIQLTLTNRFNVALEDTENEVDKLYLDTKEHVIHVLRTVPIQKAIQRLFLTDVLEAGAKYAEETSNTELLNEIHKVIDNLGKLEREGRVSKKDRYEGFLHDLSLELANRAAISEQQKKVVARLRQTLDDLKRHQAYLDEQIKQYKTYLKACKDKQAEADSKKSKKKLEKPIKLTYKELTKKRVIVDSQVPAPARSKTVFVLKQDSDSPGTIHITAKIGGVTMHREKLELDELLERNFNNITRLELEQVTLDVNMTIHLINRLFFT